MCVRTENLWVIELRELERNLWVTEFFFFFFNVTKHCNFVNIIRVN